MTSLKRQALGWSAVGVGAATAMIVAVAGAWPASAQRDAAKVFTVGNFPVEASAANAVAAKDRAIADGQRAAWRSLLKRLVPVTSYSRLKPLREIPMSSVYDGFAVRSERNSATTYIAGLDFAFRPDAVRNVLRRERIPFVEEQAREVVLIAAVREAGKLDRDGAGARRWMATWNGLDLANTLTPLRAEPVKPVIHNDTLNMLVGGDHSAIRVLANEYNGDDVLTAIAEVDRPAGRLHVTLAGRDAAGVFNVKRSYRLFDGDVDYAMELAAVVSLGIVEGRWKSIKVRGESGADEVAAAAGAGYGAAPGGGAGGESVHIEAEFSSLGEWNAMRERLEATPGVGNVEIAAVSARGADLALSFPGGGPSLASALAARGMSLRDLGGAWLLRSGN